MTTRHALAAAALSVLFAGPVAAQSAEPLPPEPFNGIASAPYRVVLEYRPAARVGFGWDAIRNEPPPAPGATASSRRAPPSRARRTPPRAAGSGSSNPKPT